MPFRKTSLLVLLCLLIAIGPATGCADEALVESDDPDGTEEPEVPDDADESDEGIDPDSLFARYVAMGSSMTAGYQARGINRDTQLESYAVLLAEAMGTEIHVPLIDLPGCPPPITNVLTGERLSDESCTSLIDPNRLVLHNVAVPGAHLRDLFEDPEPDSMTAMMLGGRTQLEALAEARPSFVSIFFGYDKAVQAFLTGDPRNGFREFNEHLRQLVDTLATMGVRGGVVVGIPSPLAMPWWMDGKAYVDAEAEGLLPDTYEVVYECRDITLVPYDYGIGELLQRANDGEHVVLDCWNDGPVLDYPAITLGNTLEAINTNAELEIKFQRGWAWVDPRAIHSKLRESCDFPDLAELIESSSPSFGSCVSLDGVHLSKEGHRILAEEMISAINDAYGSNLTGL